MTKQDHIDLAKRIWDGRHRHRDGTCECANKPDAFTFLGSYTPAQFAEWYIASRTGLPSVEEIVGALR